MRVMIFAPMLFVALFITGCTTTGNGVQRQMTVNEQDARLVNIAGPWSVTIVCNADRNELIINAEENLWEKIRANVKSPRIELSVRGKIEPTLPMTVVLYTTGSVNEIGLGGAANAVVTGVNAQQLYIDMADTAFLMLPDSNKSDELKVNMKDESTLLFSGSARDCDARTSGASYARFRTFIDNADFHATGEARLDIDGARNMQIRLSRNGRMMLDNLTERMFGVISQNSAIYYRGDGKLRVETLGKSRIHKL